MRCNLFYDEPIGKPAEKLLQIAIENKMTPRVLIPALGQNIMAMMPK
jgi:hypothetical protein